MPFIIIISFERSRSTNFFQYFGRQMHILTSDKGSITWWYPHSKTGARPPPTPPGGILRSERKKENTEKSAVHNYRTRQFNQLILFSSTGSPTKSFKYRSIKNETIIQYNSCVTCAGFLHSKIGLDTFKKFS